MIVSKHPDADSLYVEVSIPVLLSLISGVDVHYLQ